MAPHRDTLLPSAFGPYELLGELGRGGCAEVLLARLMGPAGFERRVALKRLLPELADDPAQVSHLIQEANLGARLTHPGLCAVRQLGKVGDTWFIEMEHLDGADLNRLLRARRALHQPMPPALAVHLAAEVAATLSWLHGDDEGPGFVHGDLSPHNVFLTRTGAVKLLDLALAHPVGGPAARGAGKHGWCAPEVVSGEPVDGRADVFTLGLLLGELLTHRRLRRTPGPFAGFDATGLTPEVTAVLADALHPHPDHRPDAATLAARLRALSAAYPPVSRADLGALVADLTPPEPPLTLPIPAPIGPPVDTTSDRTPAPADPAGEERRRVVALVIDVDGLTALSLRAEPEELFRAHLHLLRWLREVVDAHGGTVHRAHDDQLTVFFGLPRTRRDDLVRAVDCALALQRRQPDLLARGVPAHLAIGVHTGEITIDATGRRLRYTARGDTTRLARRLSERADHGEVLLSPAVAELLGDGFLLEPGGMLPARGRRPAAPMVRVRGRDADHAARPGGPWLPRGDELPRLRERLHTLLGGRGGAVIVSGETGSGKSRLLREVADAARRRGLAVLQGTVDPFHPPAALLRALLLDALASVPTPPDDAGLRRLGLAGQSLRTASGLLAEPRSGGTGADAWEVTALALAQVASRQPAVVILEDVHHLDRATTDHLAHLLTALADRPVLAVLSQPRTPPPALAALPVLRLGPLPPDAQARLAADAVGAGTIDAAFAAFLVRTCLGSPLHVEAVARWLVQSGHAALHEGVARLHRTPDDEVPAVLADLLIARIDDLDPAARGLLQVAALLGPTFDADVVAEALGIDDPRALLDELRHHGLLRPDLPTRFTTPAVMDAALHGTLGVQRREQHRRLAEVLAARATTAADHGAVAAQWVQAQQAVEAARAFGRAGEAFDRGDDPIAAIAAWRTGLAELDRHPDPHPVGARREVELLLLLRLGEALDGQGDRHAARRSLHLALELAADGARRRPEAEVHLALGRLHRRAGETLRAAAHEAAAATIAAALRDPDLQPGA